MTAMRTIVPPALAAQATGVEMSTLRTWVHRGKISRYPDGVDLREVLAWLDRRDTRKVTRSGATRPVADL